ncbi:MAG: dephospho-CoA kinase [Planctomycetota bacterium]
MKIIGLTGGIASGKSFVARLFAEHGAVVLDADRHAHAALAEAEVVRQLTDRFGDAIVDQAGALIRGEVAKRVFGDDPRSIADREFLESLVHPLVRERLRADLAKARTAGVSLAVLDIPLLYESGWADECDAVVFVETAESVRQARAADRGWKPAELARREAAQLAVAEKRNRSDYRVSGEKEPLARRQVADIHTRLTVSDA